MAAAGSTAAEDADDPCDEAQVNAVLLHQVSTTGLSLLSAQPRQELLAGQLDQVAVAAQVNTAASLVGALEFVLTPSIGALSDRVGRRPLMLAAPAVGLITRALAAWRPTAFALNIERVLCDLARALAGTTMCYAALADIFTGGPALTAALARCNSAMGIGMVLAPLVAPAVAQRGGGPRAVLCLAALLTVVQLVLEWRLLILPRRGSEPAAATEAPRFANPFGFVQLFTRCGPRVRAAAGILAMQCAIDGKLLQDQIGLVQMFHGQWTMTQRSLWASCFGGVIVVGGRLTKRLVALFGGEQPFASAAHFCSALAFLAYSRSLFWLGLLPLVIGQQRRTPTIAWLLADAEAHGIGRGEMVAMTANLRAAVETVGPIVYGAAQRLAARLGQPARVFYAPALLALLAEAIRAFSAASSCGGPHPGPRPPPRELVEGKPPVETQRPGP